jgi:hypothetical protein
MKHLISLFAVLFSFALTSCSDVNDNSLLTNPVMEKTTTLDSGIETAPVYPYPYLFNFAQLKELKFVTLEGQNSIDFYMPEGSPKFAHLFVVVNYNQELDSKMFFVDEISDNSFKVEGVIASDVQNISVYGFEVGHTEGNISYPFTNNSAMSEIAIGSWKNDNRDLTVECAGIWPSSLKYVFAQLETKYGSFLVFLQRPYASNFVIPEYGKYGVESIRLYGYHTIMEKYVAKN